MKFRVLLIVIGLGSVALVAWWVLLNLATPSNESASGIVPTSTLTLTPIPKQSAELSDPFELLPVSVADFLQYEGMWQSEPRQREDGKDYFEYEFKTYISSVKVELKQKVTDLSLSIAKWTAFVEVDSTPKQMKDRRLNFSEGAAGKMVQTDKESLVLEYERIVPEGKLQFFRHELTFVHEYRFDSITYVAQDDGWLEVERNTWLKVIP